MSAPFDPYHAWLGIPAADQPPHHYRLLGLEVFESDSKVVDHAADRIMYHLRTLTSGPNGHHSQKLLNEVAAARATLVDPDLKGPYDTRLRAKLRPAARPAPAAQLAPQVHYQPVMVPVPVPVHYAPQPVLAPIPLPPVPLPLPPAPLPPISAPPVLASETPAVALSFRRRTSAAGGSRGGRDFGKLAVGGLVGLAAGVLLLWFVARSDPFGWYGPLPGKAVVKATKVVQPTGTKGADAVPVPPVVPATPDKDPPATPSNPEATTPPSPPPTTDPAPSTPEPAPLPVVPTEPVDPRPTPPPAVDSRRATPTADEQQAKLAELKEVYKADFESGAKPAGREAFTEFLIETADKLRSDPVARFVLLREGYGGLLKAKDYAAAAEVVDRLDREFAMDPYKLRLHVLKDASANARLPGERQGIAICALELMDLATRQQRLTEAGELVRIAEAQARVLGDAPLKAKVSTAKLGLDKLVDSWGPVERARKALAANPNDPEAALVDGKYRCLVEGDWSAGLPLLALGKDAELAAAARLDVAGPAAAVRAATLGDQWYEIARGDAERAGFHARARHWYRQAAAQLEGLDKVRIEQRIEQIEAMNLASRLLEEQPSSAAGDSPLPAFFPMLARAQPSAPVDLFSFVSPQSLAVGGWSLTGGPGSPQVSSNASARYARLAAAAPLPREYQVRLDVHRPSSDLPASEAITGPLVIGLVGPKGPFLVVLDAPSGGSFASFLNLADARTIDDNKTARKLASPLILVPMRQGGFGGGPSRSATILCQVRRRSVVVSVDGIEACRLEGDLSPLTMPKEWGGADGKSLMVGSSLCRIHLERWTVESLVGEAAAAPSPLPGFAPPMPQN
ncbi:MAG: hypothetical protein SFU86_09475 [Pirellulaceae bacterium]|nr:hypothetical protein [Pirellulaceae bacterium]